MKKQSEHELKPKKTARPIRLIGAGLGRTGTMSLVSAMNELGEKPYHMTTGVFETPGQLELWVKYVDAERSGDESRRQSAADELIDSFVAEGFTTTFDYPVCLIYKDLMKRFPDAKVLLSLRSGPEVWAKSVLQTIGRVHILVGKFPLCLNPRDRKFYKVSKYLWEAMPCVEMDEAGVLNEETLIRGYEAWKEEVLRSVPKNRLITFQAKEGWKPLCDCLGTEVPDKPYPHVNSTAQFQQHLQGMQRIINYWWIAPTIVVAAAALGAMALSKNR